MSKRVTTAILIALATVALAVTLSPAASAQEVIMPWDSATGYDHVGPPPDGSFSSADWCFSFSDPSLVGTTIEVVANGPGGEVRAEGTVGSDGKVKVPVGITEGGEYTVTSITETSSGRAVSAANVERIDVVFDPPLIDCLENLATAPPPTTTTIAETTTSSTTEATTSTTAPVTEAPSTAPPATDPPPSQAPSDGSSGAPMTLILIGILLLFVAAFIIFFPGITIGSTKDRCERERKEVARLTADLKKAEATEKTKRAEEARLQGEIEKIRFKRTGNPQQREIQERKLIKQQDAAFQAAQNAAAYTRTIRETLAKAKAALDACEKRPTTPGPTAPGTTGGGESGGGTAPPEEKPKHPDCCPNKDWVGFNVYTGGIIGLGVESGVITLFCKDDPSRWAAFKWTGIRAGLALGGEASGGLFIVIDGGVHPYELSKTIAKILGGFDGDLSVGLSWSKLLKGAAKTGGSLDKLKKLKDSVETVRTASKALNKSRKAGDVQAATKIATEHAEAFKNLVREGAADSLAETAIKSGSSAYQAEGSGLNIPFGKGLQAGIWWLFTPSVELIALSGCKNCDPSQ